MWLGMNHVIMANHMISLITSSTDPRIIGGGKARKVKTNWLVKPLTIFPTLFGLGLGLGLWCLMPFSTISLQYRWRSVLLVEEYREKTTDLPQVHDKLYHIMLYQVYLTWVRFKLTMLVVIGIDCIGSYKSNYHQPYDHNHSHWQVGEQISSSLGRQTFLILN